MAQNLQPTSSFLQIVEGYEDLETVVAVLEAQEGFETRGNLARYFQDTPLEVPEGDEKIKYLGYFLTRHLNPRTSFEVELRFLPRYAYTPLVLMLKGFGLKSQKRGVQLTQGLILHQESTVNTAGMARFAFEPLSDWLKDVNRVVGFMVYVLWPKQRPRVTEEQERSQLSETESGIIRARPGLNVYRKIDTRV